MKIKSYLSIILIIGILICISVFTINIINDSKSSYPAIFQGWASMFAFLILIWDKISKAEEDRQINWRKNRPFLEVKPNINYSSESWNGQNYKQLKSDFLKSQAEIDYLILEKKEIEKWKKDNLQMKKISLQNAKYFKIQNCSDISGYDIVVTICKGKDKNSQCLSHYISSLRTNCESEIIYEDGFLDPDTKMPKEGLFNFEEYLETCNENSNCKQLFVKLEYNAIPRCEMKSKLYSSVFRVIYLIDDGNLVVRNIIQEDCENS